MQVFSLGDQFKLVVSRNALAFQHAGKRGQVGCIDDQELVLVELDLHGAQGGQSCQAGAAVVQEEILEIAAIAFQDRQVDVLAKQVAVIGVTRRGAVGVVAGFKNDVDYLAQGIEEVKKNVEKLFAGDRGGQDGDLEAGA